jgi:hypothetical protein
MGIINGSNECHTARAKEIGFGSEREGEMPMNAVAIVGWNGNGIAIKLSLGETNGCEGGRIG